MSNPTVGSRLALIAFALLFISPLAAKAGLVRVKIFPHNSSFAEPQKKEAVMDKLQFTSKTKCTLYQAETLSAADGITRVHPLASSTGFSFSAASFNGPFWLECLGPATMIRAGMNSPSTFAGHFFLKKIIPERGGLPYLTVVNVLPFEEYLKAVVPAEMDPSWPAEALKAQAIAARTYALFEIAGDAANEDPKITEEKSGAQLDDTIFFQAYQGTEKYTAATSDAVEKTKDIAMLYNNSLIKAYFHGDSGGHTEDSANAFDIPLPYAIGRAEIYSPGSVPHSEWTVVTSFVNAAMKLAAAKLLTGRDQISSLRIAANDILPSGRAAWVTVMLHSGKALKIKAREFRFALGLRSTWLQFSPAKGGNFTIQGKGWGHGAGMNQWGARLMATQLKKNYEDILKFYYAGIEIKRYTENSSYLRIP